MADRRGARNIIYFIIICLPFVEYKIKRISTSNLPWKSQVSEFNFYRNKTNKKYVHFYSENIKYSTITSKIYDLSIPAACIYTIFESCQASGSQTDGLLNIRPYLKKKWVISYPLTKEYTVCEPITIENNYTIKGMIPFDPYTNYAEVGVKEGLAMIPDFEPNVYLQKYYYRLVKPLNHTKKPFKERKSIFSYFMLNNYFFGLSTLYKEIYNGNDNQLDPYERSLVENCNIGDIRYKILILNSTSLSGIAYKNGSTLLVQHAGVVTDGYKSIHHFYNDETASEVTNTLKTFILCFIILLMFQYLSSQEIVYHVTILCILLYNLKSFLLDGPICNYKYALIVDLFLVLIFVPIRLNPYFQNHQ